ncbi:four helix bundle protein [Candidatus Uhrbacteria bacterium]|nr:four helix bundle protein [Candidatus Uhrbacteria bacterium]
MCAWHIRSKKFPKFERYTIGKQIFDLLLASTVCVLKAQRLGQDEKRKLLEEGNMNIDCVKVLVRLTHSLNLLDEQLYAQIETQLQETGGMLGGWIGSIPKSSH